jgi:hypothetical protein
MHPLGRHTDQRQYALVRDTRLTVQCLDQSIGDTVIRRRPKSLEKGYWPASLPQIERAAAAI